MRTDNVLSTDAIKLLVKGLGEVETERFIYLIKRDNFDYTEWQRTLWEDKTLDEINEAALAYAKQKNIPNLPVETDENGYIIVDKDKDPDLYDWAVNG